ncbi:MAG: D-aminoacylase [Candidatus Neomarinimicrobiota bacterium]
MKRRDFIKISALAGTGLIIGCHPRNRLDIIIRNGNLLDGSGNPAMRCDLGIRGGKIVTLDDLSTATADRIIDASNLVVSPGFIDVHSHTDIELLVNPRAESKIRQGVTTEISGNCGDSPFPMNEADFEEYRQRQRDNYGLEVDWRNLPEFLAAIKNARSAINYATLVGHGNLRAYVVGKNDVQPTAEQLRRMQSLLAEMLEEGAVGLSTGLEYAPGSYAKTDELIELCRVVARHDNIYATHLRNEDDTVEEAVAEALQICRAAGVSTQISHLKACNRANWPKTDRLIEMISTARRQDLPVEADRYPYIAWSTGLGSFLPLWARQGETGEVLARLQDKKQFAEIAKYSQGRGARIGGWEQVVICECNNASNKVWEGQAISECSHLSGKEPVIFIRDLLVDEKMRVGVIGFAMDEDGLKKVLAAPFTAIGSDGNAVSPSGLLGKGKPHPRYYGTFPRVLGKYARDEKVFDLSTAIHKITAQPARKFGLKQRGEIRPGYFADIVIFDPATITDRATFIDPHQFPTGIEYVIVNGKISVEKGTQNATDAGQVL